MKIIKLFIIPIFFLLNLCMLSYAAPIKKILITGEMRTNQDYIKAILAIQEGTVYSQELIANAVKRLYQTGLFSNIKVDFDNTALTIEIKENAVINNIYFEGNKEIKTTILEKELMSAKRTAMSVSKVSFDIQRMINLYKRKGYLLVVVTPKIVEQDYNTVDLIFEITEGIKSSILNIDFVGNKSMSSQLLKGIILTKEDRWWRFFNSNDTYDPERIAYDGEILKNYYLEQGYPNFTVLSSTTEILKNSLGFKVIYNIDEGVRYKYGDIIFNIKIAGITQYEYILKEALTIKKGTWFKQSELLMNAELINSILNGLEYQFIQVNFYPIYNDLTKTVDIVFSIQETEKLFINKINILGNTRTLDKVIRREVRFAEGDSFDQEKLTRSRNRIYGLGYFSIADINVTTGDSKDTVNLDINVEEQSTGSISAGGGYSTINGFSLEGSYSEQNLFGTGKQFGINAYFSKKIRSYSISLGEPYLFDRDLYGSVVLFRSDSNSQMESSYDSTSQGIRLSMSYSLAERIRQGFTYELSQRNIYNIKFGASSYIQLEAGSKVSSKISHNIIFNYKDNNYYTTAGYSINLDTTFAGVFGDVNFISNELKVDWYYEIYEGTVFSLAGNFGIIEGLNGQSPGILDRYFLGSYLLRGFEWAGVGPKDLGTKDSLGGKYLYRGSAQIDIPVPGVPNYGLLFHLFSDFGNTSGLDFSRDNVIDFKSIRVSAGFGIAWRSPFGNIGLDWGWPVVEKSGDETQVFLINFGTRL